MNKLILEQRFVEIIFAPKILSDLISVEKKGSFLEMSRIKQLSIYSVNSSITLVSLAELSSFTCEPDPSKEFKESIEKHSTFLGWRGISLLTGLMERDSKRMLRAINKYFNRMDTLNAPCSLFDVDTFLYNHRIRFDLDLGHANA